MFVLFLFTKKIKWDHLFFKWKIEPLDFLSIPLTHFKGCVGDGYPRKYSLNVFCAILLSVYCDGLIGFNNVRVCNVCQCNVSICNGCENWKDCKYLESLLDTKDINRRKGLAISAFNRMKCFFENKKLGLQLKVRLFAIYVETIFLNNSEYNTTCKRPRGKPKLTWIEIVLKNMCELNLTKEDAKH